MFSLSVVIDNDVISDAAATFALFKDLVLTFLEDVLGTS